MTRDKWHMGLNRTDVQRAWVSLFVSRSYYIILTDLFLRDCPNTALLRRYLWRRITEWSWGGGGFAKTQFFMFKLQKRVNSRADLLAKISNFRPCPCHYILETWCVIQSKCDLIRGLDIHAYATRGRLDWRTSRHRTVVFKRLSSQAVAQFVKKLPI